MNDKIDREELGNLIEHVENVIDNCIEKHVVNDPNYINLYYEIDFLLARKKGYALVVYGRGGMGKTTSVKKILEDLKKKYNISYIYINKRLEYIKDLYELFNVNVDLNKLKKYNEDLFLDSLKIILDNFDVLVIDDAKISRRLQELLQSFIEDYNKKIIFIVNDTKELENISKIALNRAEIIYYDLEEETIINIINDISKELNVEINKYLVPLRVLKNMIAKMYYYKLQGIELDVSRIIYNYFMRELKKKKSIEQRIEEIAKFLVDNKEYKKVEDLVEDIIDMLVKVYKYADSTIDKKIKSKVYSISSYILLSKELIKKIKEDGK